MGYVRYEFGIGDANEWLQDFEGGRRKVKIKVKRVIHGNRHLIDEKKRISHTADSDDEDEDGWNEVERAGHANKANPNVYSFKKIEEDTRLDDDQPRVADAAKANKDNKILQITSQQTGQQRGSGPTGRYTTKASKWGAPVVDPLGDNQWDSYARGMDHSRMDNIKKMKQKKEDSSEDDDW